VILEDLYRETMKLESLLKIMQHVTVTGPEYTEILGICCDSRLVRPGWIFVAIPGTRQDGADFIAQAIERGAAVVVSELAPSRDEGVSYIHVEDARRALAELSCAFYGNPASRLKMLGITGTNGKTTCAFMSQAILQAAGLSAGMLGTVWYEMGERRIPAGRTTPEAPRIHDMLKQMLRNGCHSAVMEISSHALVQQRVWGIDFDVGVFTNLTRDHLDYHGNMEDYFRAKSLLFRGLGQMEKHASAVINIDSPWGQKLAAIHSLSVQVMTYGEHPMADVRAEDIVINRSGSMFKLVSPWGRADVRLAMPGRFNVSNALAALASCAALGVDLSVAVDALNGMRAVPGRLEPVSNKRDLAVFVDYAHTPDALNNVLETLRELTDGRLLTVFGCGGNRDRTKRPMMGAVADRRADFTVLTTDNPRGEDPRAIIGEIEEGFGKRGRYEVVEDRAAAIARILALAEPGDTVLIAGKGHENYQEFADTVVPFDDKQTAETFLRNQQ